VALRNNTVFGESSEGEDRKPDRGLFAWIGVGARGQRVVLIRQSVFWRQSEGKKRSPLPSNTASAKPNGVNVPEPIFATPSLCSPHFLYP
jgi:hypothetical protein